MNKYKLVNFVGGFVFVGVCFYSVTNLVNLEKYSENTIDNNYNLLHNSEYDIEHYKSISPILKYESAEKIIKDGEELQRKKEWEERMRQVKLEKERLAELERQRLARIEEKKKQQKQIVVSRGSNYQSTYEATHYVAFCSTGCQGKTATGYDVSNTIYYQGYRIVAASPNIPFYTKLRITYQDGTTFDAIVLDRGGAIKGKILDVLVSSKEEAYRLGRQKVKVEIIK